ncbi:hypothetical protein KVV02_007172 [Mortierella alpina]|uniref:Disease resistance R13L4/SHOC-2-like LRR domain-containing protein n=1 Tax=Mortierella alpina TaxID=64518 RepID=A0A9P8A322_MORAP|nr:hypothetical protein KVV02_007172 [Mortierella alpina]
MTPLHRLRIALPLVAIFLYHAIVASANDDVKPTHDPLIFPPSSMSSDADPSISDPPPPPSLSLSPQQNPTDSTSNTQQGSPGIASNQTVQSQTSSPHTSPSLQTPYSGDTRAHNKAASALNLVHVPLKTSCEILRQFYNSTGGIDWSNQDGWQYVDSVTIPAGPQTPRYNQRDAGTAGSVKSEVYKRSTGSRHVEDAPSDPPPPSNSYKLPPPAGSVPSPSMDDASIDSLPVPTTNPPMNMDPNNCCGWYGVVCIGPDGIIPPPWPPYDDDLITNRASLPGYGAGSSGTEAQRGPLRKRDLPPGSPFYNYHNRNPHRGGGSGHDHGSGSRGTGGKDNRRHPDKDNDDGASADGDGYHDDDDHDDDDDGPPPPPIAPPTTTRPGGRGQQIDDWYIIELHLGFNGLKGPVPSELGNLINLMILDISNNDLTGELPESYGKLTRLKRLDVSSNKITGAFPEAVTKMTSIQELVIKNNYLTGPLPLSIMKLKQLTELSIANNEFDSMLPSGLFASLTKLRVINISQNGFTGEIGPEVGSLAGLLKFSARANELTGRIPKEFGGCKQLQYLNLGDNHFSGELPESIYGLQTLSVLELPGNKLSGAISPRIGDLLSLTRLILSHNDFNGTIPVEIQNLTRLEYMVINYNKFDGIFPVAVAPPQITICIVQPNEFTGCPPNASIDTSTTLAYQCNLDCRDRVIHPEIYDDISMAQTIRRQVVNSSPLASAMLLLFGMAMQVL